MSARRLRMARLLGQSLENRTVPATFVASSLADSGAGSLRAAIVSANANPGDDSIVFQPSLVGIITLTTGELAINDGLTIFGTNVVVSGNNASRVFNTNGSPASTKVTFITLTIVNGLSTSDGGAILVGDEAVTVSGCTIANSTAGGASGDGGGIAVETGGTLTLANSTISGNQSNDDGGGIYLGSGAAATISNCAIIGSTANDEGGGIQCLSSSLTLVGCTLSGNAANSGAGVDFRGTVGNGGLTVRNSTISGNTAVTTGGGVALVAFSGTLSIQNSTVTANRAAGAGGGGIGRLSGTGAITLESTVVAGNVDTAAGNEDLFTSGSVTAKFSAIGTKAGVTTFSPDATTTALLGANLKLGALASNGGPTQTHVPAPDSPLINQGSNPANLTTDQRSGAAARNANGGVDIGAVELQSFFVTNAGDSGPGSLRAAVANANTFIGADSIMFGAAFSSPLTIKLTTGEIGITDAVTITGPPARVTLDGNGNSAIFNTDLAKSASVIVFQNLSMTHGVATNSFFSYGGAIGMGDEALTLRNCIVTNCRAPGVGGVLFANSSSGSVLIEDSILSGNSADIEGGALGLPGGALTIRRSTISDNEATDVGGAMFIGSDTSVKIEDSTLSGNTCYGSIDPANEGGGAIYFRGNAANFLISNSTLSGNAAPQACGGAICLRQFTGTAVIRNCTITGNSAGVTGGAFARISGTGGLTLSSTIIAGNANTAAPDISFDTVTNVVCDHSLIGAADGIPLIGSGNFSGSKVSPLSAKLGPLQDNGGSTKTHFLLAGSPCIDAGANTAGLTSDQRGSGFQRVRGAAADIGAVEIAQSLLVTNTNDAGLGSLRAVLANANAQVGADTVTFDAAFFTTAKTITLTGGEIAITEAVTVAGPTVPLTISGNNTSRIFNTNGAPSKAAITFQNMTLTAGKITGSGGAILIGDEAVSLLNCAVTNCTASVFGGAISANLVAASLLIQDCTLSGNDATTGGGGAINVNQASAVNIRRSNLSGNTAADSGGAIYFSANGSLLVEDSTLSGNVANVTNPTSGGGAIYFYGTASKFQITNSTISGNTAPLSSGGGVCLVTFGGTAVFQNSTVTDNTAGHSGGGIARPFGTTGAVSLTSTIVAGNVNATAPDLAFTAATTVNANHSLVGVADAGNFTLSGAGNLTGTQATPLDAKLGPLTDNGGPTVTHELLAGSPALDKGSNPASLATDQRGIGFARAIGAAPDIGAFESQSLPPAAKVATMQINGGSVQRSQVTALKVTFDQHVTLPGTASTAFALVRLGDNKTVSLAAAVDNSGTGTAVALTFTGGAIDGVNAPISLADGRYKLSVVASKVNNGTFDGNGDGTAGDDFVLTGTPANGLFRLFGDNNGDGAVNGVDFLQFRLAFQVQPASPSFDFDGDGQINGADFLQFRLRFQQTI